MTEVRNGDVVRIHYTAKTIDGMTVGETKTVTVPAEEGYGPRDEAKVRAVPRSAVPDSTEVGTKLQASTSDGRKIPLTVVNVDDEQVTVDANHPLAGQDLVFDVEVVEIVASAA